MDWTKLQEVLTISVPVFGVMGLGKILERRGVLGPERRDFINWLVYYFSLPALIFHAVARQRLGVLFNADLLVPALLSIVLVTVIYAAIARVCKFRGAFAAAFVFGTFWANVSYMGFPLSRNAFGETGLALAAVYNAFLLPAYLILAFFLMAAYGAASGGRKRTAMLRGLANPVVLAALSGIALSVAAEPLRDSGGDLVLPGFVLGALSVAGGFLKLVGDMGLPLVLLAIGGALHWKHIEGRKAALGMMVAGKLIVTPMLCLILVGLLAPDAPLDVRAIAVLMSAMPAAVASYVVSRQMGVEEGFVALMLAVSTGLSTITVPIWLYILL